MLNHFRAVAAAIALVGLAIVTSGAEPKIEEAPIAPTGRWVGCAFSPKGVHAAMLCTKGSRFAVMVDGMEGPRIDQMFGPDSQPNYPGQANQVRDIPPLFSDDGAHCAYFGKAGEEFIVVLDGKELYRGKFQNGFASAPLTFSAGGKHLFFCEQTEGGYHVVMDGKPEPTSHSVPHVVTSPDGEHYAYVGTVADGNETPWGFVDGKQVKYFGGDLQFTAKGHLVGLIRRPGEMALNVDGKNTLIANSISQVTLSPTGGMIGAMVYIAKANKTILTINGKAVPGTEGALVQNMFFSPDDKHFAALCTGSSGAYMIIDGKKGQQYNLIGTGGGALGNAALGTQAWANGQLAGDPASITPALPCFTADSSKFVYVAQVGLQSFLVTNDDESDGYKGVISPVISPDGKHIAFIAKGGSATEKPVIVIDGQTKTLGGHAPQVGLASTSFSYSRDSAHYLFTSGGVVYLDGVEQTDVTCGGQYLFSPDSHHVLMLGALVADATRSGMILDGKLVTTGSGANNILRPTFSPDSQHVYWMGNRAPEATDDFLTRVLYVDGKPTSLHVTESCLRLKGDWEVAPDGVLTFVAQQRDELKRFRVTPAPDRTVATMVAEVPAAGGK
jgi:hypothetical protein